MNAYEYAMKMEKDGEKYYRELADKSLYSGLKMVFKLLANEEVKHYNVVKDMMKNSDLDVKNLDITLDSKTVYELLSTEQDSVDFNKDEIKFYEEAIAREEGSEAFYIEKANEFTNEKQKDIFLKLAEEEAKHTVVLKNILDYLEEPKNFVAAAEF